MTKDEIEAMKEAKEMIDRSTSRLVEVGMFKNKKEVEKFQKEFMEIYNKTRGTNRGFVTFYVMVDLVDETCGLHTCTRSNLIDMLCDFIDRGSKQ